MTTVLLIQLPVPQTNFGRQTGNIPLAAGWLKLSAGTVSGAEVSILPENVSAYGADAFLLDWIRDARPDIVGFTLYCWNVDRSLHLARKIKQSYPTRVICGGPEVTPDNLRIDRTAVDFLVFGDGELLFQQLLQDPGLWKRGAAHGSADMFFQTHPSPYMAGLIAPGVSRVMLLETQRGCPYRCRYCYYNKARPRVTPAPAPQVAAAVRWAVDHNIHEIYLLDPCLTARPDVPDLVEALARHNPGGALEFGSEIRAESVTEFLAGRFQAAGFRWFEIGLQSTNPKALMAMNRQTDLSRFIAGVHRLKQHGMAPKIDLILGLPGDDLAGFQRSVDFLAAHDAADDVQVFPLSILPGTDFRRHSRSLGVDYTPHPSYTVTATSTFSQEQMIQAAAYAQERLGISFFTFPDLNIAWRQSGHRDAEDVRVRIGHRLAVAKVYLHQPRPLGAVEALAATLTHPYQVFVDSGFADQSALCRTLTVLSAANPFTPFEIVFLGASPVPSPEMLLAAIRLERPHFLDIEERFLLDASGNRSVVFTHVCESRDRRFAGQMVRQVFWWRRPVLPDDPDLEALAGLDGVLIDAAVPRRRMAQWQDRFAPSADDLPPIAFADIAVQHRWLKKTAPDAWAPVILDAMG